MKNLMFALLALFAFSFSYAQNNSSKENAMKLKKNSAEVINYLTGELKLDDTKKTIVANAFSEYASNVSKLNDKLSAKSSKMSEKEISKMTFEKMAQFTKLRDAKIMDVLNDKEDEKYLKLSNNYDPMTLSMKKKKK